MNTGHMSAYAVSSAAINYYYNDTDTLYSIRAELERRVSPSLALGADQPAAGDAFLFVEPIIGQFQRPAITIELITTTPHTPWPAQDPSSFVTMSIAFRVYDYKRAGTMALSEKLMSALGAYGGTDLRIPLWAFWTPPNSQYPAIAFRLARMLRVDRSSIAPSLEEPDDDRMWSRTIQARVTGPRNRDVSAAARLRLISPAMTGH